MQLRIVRCLGEDLAIQRQGTIEVAESGAHRRVGRTVSAIAGIELEQFLHLPARLEVLVALDQDDCVFVARQAMVGRDGERALEQQFGVIDDIEIQADLREQPHRLDVIAMGQEIPADDILGVAHLAVRVHAEGGHDLGRKLRRGAILDPPRLLRPPFDPSCDRASRAHSSSPAGRYSR